MQTIAVDSNTCEPSQEYWRSKTISEDYLYQN